MIDNENPVTYSELFSNKSVDFRFSGNNFKFLLSQFLFSSFDIDSGSKLLLKTIAQNVDFSHISDILDIGCGIGTLGIALSKIGKQAEIYLVDKDALALLFSKANAEINKSGNIHIAGSLGINDISKRGFNLIVSNIPAKAGEPVIEQMMLYSLTALSPDGIAAIVIVKPLEKLAEKILIKNKCDIIFTESAKEYSVFHYNGKPNIAFDNPFSSYFRSRAAFEIDKLKYKLQTVYGNEEFDTLHFKSVIAVKLLSNINKGNKILFYNPGQGHLPVIYACLNKNNHIVFHLGGRDLLSLKISEYNLLHHNINKDDIVMHHTPSLFDINETYETIILFPDLAENPFMQKNLLLKAAELLTSKGQIIVIGQSTYIQRILNEKNDLTLIRSLKNKGYRGVLLGKKNNTAAVCLG